MVCFSVPKYFIVINGFTNDLETFCFNAQLSPFTISVSFNGCGLNHCTEDSDMVTHPTFIVEMDFCMFRD